MSEHDYMNDWVDVVFVTTQDNYDWIDLGVYYSPTARRWFWYEDSGCSCYSWEAPPTVEEWENGDKDAALRALDNFQGYGDYAASDRIDDKLTVRNFKETR